MLFRLSLIRSASRSRAVLLVALLMALAPALLVGCRRSAPKPEPMARYRSLGARGDFPSYFKDTILEAVDVQGIEPVFVSGYGVVVNLENTGRDDGIPSAVRDFVANTAMVRGVGSQHTAGTMGELSSSQFLGDPRIAVVRVDGVVPPGARKGQRIDVRVSALETNTTTSLARGELWRTELHSGNVTPQNPAERVNLAGQARGRLAVNPVYALEDPMQVKQDPSAQASLRSGYIQDGGIFDLDRVIILRLREPSWRMARAVEHRINLYFGAPVAAAQDEGVVYLTLPREFRGDWPHFVGVATTLFFYSVNKQYALERADELVKAATDPSRDPISLEGISYAWEALGAVATSKLVPLFSDPNPAIAFWAARAAAFNEEPAAVDTLVRIAGELQNPYAVAAAQTLGKLKHSSGGVLRKLRGLLEVPAPDVRVAAYQSLRALDPQSIVTTEIGEKVYGPQFYLDRVGSSGPPILWASRTGTPRLAMIGTPPRLRSGALAAAFGNRLTVSVSGDGRRATVFHRPLNDHNSSVDIFPDVLELAATLGGEARPGEVPIRLCYGDVIALLKRMCDDGQIVDGQGRPVLMILEDVSASLIDEAPSIPGLESIAGDDLKPAVKPGAAADGAASGGASSGPGRVTAARE